MRCPVCNFSVEGVGLYCKNCGSSVAGKDNRSSSNGDSGHTPSVENEHFVKESHAANGSEGVGQYSELHRLRTGDVGYLDGDITDNSVSVGKQTVININRSDDRGESLKTVVKCIVCGSLNMLSDTFECQECRRTDLCKRHMNQEHLVCVFCAEKKYGPIHSSQEKSEQDETGSKRGKGKCKDSQATESPENEVHKSTESVSHTVEVNKIQHFVAVATLKKKEKKWNELIETANSILELQPANKDAQDWLIEAGSNNERMELLKLKVETSKNHFQSLKLLAELRELSTDATSVVLWENKIKEKIEKEKHEQKILDVKKKTEEQARNKEIAERQRFKFSIVSAISGLLLLLILFLGEWSFIKIFLFVSSFLAGVYAIVKVSALNKRLSGLQELVVDSEEIEEQRCSSCDQIIDSQYRIGSQCQSLGCQNIICKSCWEGKRIRFCVDCQ